MHVQVEIIQYKHVHSIHSRQLPNQVRSLDLVMWGLDISMPLNYCLSRSSVLVTHESPSRGCRDHTPKQ
jgi:hypothetical protein